MLDESKFDEQEARVDSLRAFLAEQEGGLSKAMEVLGVKDDPIRYRSRLSTLIRNKDYETAYSLASSRKFHDKWGDLAIYAYVASGHYQEAVTKIENLIGVLEPDAIDKFRLGFAEAAFKHELKHLLNPSVAQIGELVANEQELLESVVDILWPIARKIQVNESIQSKVQEYSIYWLANCLGLLGRLSELTSLVAPLLRYKPIPLVLAQLARSGAMESIPDDFVARIRTEHPTDFGAQIQAVICEYEVLGNVVNAMKSLKRIKEQFPNLVEDDENKDRFSGLLFEVSARIGGNAINEASLVVRDLFGEQNQFELYFEALKKIEAKDYDNALAALQNDERIDDAVWWQMVAKCYGALNQTNEAADAMAKACELMPHPSLLNEFASLSLARKDWSPAIVALETALSKSPHDVRTLSRLATICVDVRNHLKAADQYRLLAELEPENYDHKLNLAICLARGAQLQDAIVILDSIGEPDSRVLRIILTRAQILRSADRAKEAFDGLMNSKEEYWGDTYYVAMLMDLAYRTQDGKTANEAMHRLLELQGSNSKEKRIFLSPHSLDEFVEHSIQRRKHMDELGEMVANGKMPWLYADAMFGLSTMKSWYGRSVKLDWISEERSVRGQSTIYATNNFAVLSKDDGSAEIKLILRPEGISEVVADFSALTTLFQLGRLEETLAYFDRILVPGSLAELRLNELTSHHQPAQEASLKKVKDKIDKQRIKVLDNCESVQFLDMYDEDSDAFRLENLAESLESSGKFSTENINQIRESLSQSEHGKKNKQLLLDNDIRVDLTTLTTLVKLNWFDRLLDNSKLALGREDYRLLISELAGHDQINQINDDNNRFWELLENNTERVVSIGVHFEEDPNNEFRTIPHLDAAIIATERKQALLSDDRVCQQLRFSGTSECDVAFGTDQVLLMLWHSGRITIRQAVDDYLKLIEWRYRFLIPPAEFLKELSDRSRKNLPGPELVEVARYMHECMQDPGLLCGFEKTTPPMPVAFKFNFEWMTNSIDFIRLIAEDESYDEASLKVLIRWIIKSLIPSTPNYLLYSGIGKNVACAIAGTVLKLCLSSLVAIRPVKRASIIARIVASALPLTESEFYKIAAEAANERNF